MKRIATTLLTLMLIIGMVFGAAPSAFADEPPPQPSPPDAVSVEATGQIETTPTTGQPSAEQANQQQEQTINEEATTTETSTIIEEPATTPSETDPSVATIQREPIEETSLLALAPECDQFEPTDNLSEDQFCALMELHKTLDAFFEVICSSPDFSIVRIDSGYLSEESRFAYFEESSSYKEILMLINRINMLLKECGYSTNLPALHSLPISVVGELPEGFDFSNNTLSLVKPEVLLWDEELDEPDAVTRSFDLELQLTTGVGSLDSWLACKGYPNLGSSVFLIELELIPPVDTGNPGPPVDPIDPDPPVDPKPPVNPTTPTEPTQPDIPADVTGNTEGVSYIIPENSGYPLSDTTDTSADAAVANTPKTPPAEDTAHNPFEPPANGLDLSIEAQKIPTASVMMNEESNTLVINGIVVTLSLVLGAVSLGSLRLQKKGGLPQHDNNGSSHHRARFVAGVSGIGLAAISATLFVVSQYVASGSAGSSISWTPVLVAVFAGQAVCQATVVITKRIETKKTDPRRFKVRY